MFPDMLELENTTGKRDRTAWRGRGGGRRSRRASGWAWAHGRRRGARSGTRGRRPAGCPPGPACRRRSSARPAAAPPSPSSPSTPPPSSAATGGSTRLRRGDWIEEHGVVLNGVTFGENKGLSGLVDGNIFPALKFRLLPICHGGNSLLATS